MRIIRYILKSIHFDKLTKKSVKYIIRNNYVHTMNNAKETVFIR